MASELSRKVAAAVTEAVNEWVRHPDSIDGLAEVIEKAGVGDLVESWDKTTGLAQSLQVENERLNRELIDTLTKNGELGLATVEALGVRDAALAERDRMREIFDEYHTGSAMLMAAAIRTERDALRARIALLLATIRRSEEGHTIANADLIRIAQGEV